MKIVVCALSTIWLMCGAGASALPPPISEKPGGALRPSHAARHPGETGSAQPVPTDRVLAESELDGAEHATLINTTCVDAASLACNGSVFFDNSSITNPPNPQYLCTDTSGQPDGTLWYKFVATSTSARIRTCNSVAQDSTFAVYDSCGSLIQLGRGEDGCGASEYLSDECIGGITVGQTYYIQISAWSADDRGEYTVEVDCPCPNARENTACTRAQMIDCNTEITFSNDGFSHPPLPCYSCGTGFGHTGALWYKFVATGSSTRISTCNSLAADSTVAVYAGDCNTLTEIGCSEDECGQSTYLSAVTATDLVIGRAYLIQAAAWQPADAGEYLLEVECLIGLDPLLPDASGIDKNRYISMVIPDNGGQETALRVTLVSLMHPDPPNLPQFPARDFSAFEGQVRYVGAANDCPETDVPPTTFRCATLQCTPEYRNWSQLGTAVLHVTGAEIVPSSVYDVQQLAASCIGSEASCTAVSTALRIKTARWGDVTTPFQDPSPASLSQPNISDVAGVVDKFKGAASAPIKARAQLQPNVPNPAGPINILDVANTVDAFKSFAYPYSGPTACP